MTPGDSLDQKVARLERQNQALLHHLVEAWKMIHHISLMMPDQTVAVYDRALITSHINSLQSLKQGNTSRR